MFVSTIFIVIIYQTLCRSEQSSTLKDLSWLYTPRHEKLLTKDSEQIAKKPWRPYGAGGLLLHGTHTNWVQESPYLKPPFLHKSEASAYYNRNGYGHDPDKENIKNKIENKLHTTLLGMGNLILSTVAGTFSDDNKKKLEPVQKCPEIPKDIEVISSRPEQVDDVSLAWVEEGRQMTIRVGRLLESATNLLSLHYLRKLTVKQQEEFEKQKIELKELQIKQEEFWRKVRHSIKFGVC